jgi:hypothetical protein
LAGVVPTFIYSWWERWKGGHRVMIVL